MPARPARPTLFPYTTLFRSTGLHLRDATTVQGRTAHDLHVVGTLAESALRCLAHRREGLDQDVDRKSTRLNSSHVAISYAVFCLKKEIYQPDSHSSSHD